MRSGSDCVPLRDTAQPEHGRRCVRRLCGSSRLVSRRPVRRHGQPEHRHRCLHIARWRLPRGPVMSARREAVTPRRATRAPDGERGSVTPLVIGMMVCLLLLTAGVTAAGSAFLAGQRLQRLCDGAVAAAVGASTRAGPRPRSVLAVRPDRCGEPVPSACGRRTSGRSSPRCRPLCRLAVATRRRSPSAPCSDRRL